MTSFILFPTVAMMYQAALISAKRSYRLDQVLVSARQDIADKIGVLMRDRLVKHIVIVAPFNWSEAIQGVFQRAVDEEVMIEWYAEGKKHEAELPGIPGHLVHLVENYPAPGPEIEHYLRLKKTLAFLGNEKGGFAVYHLKEAIEQLSQSLVIPQDDEPLVEAFRETDFPAIEGTSSKMRSLKKEIHRVAVSGLEKILLLGETGTGKEAAAFFLHALDPGRKTGRFGSINCAVLHEEFLISELFGHRKGAFTGAVREKEGLVARLNGGTLFLDELPDLPPRVQAMLLRFLESGTYIPLGGTTVKHANTKIISAAQGALLMEKISAGTFRKDLYYRVAGKTIRLPCLREIPDDLATLIVHIAYKIKADSSERDLAISYFLQRMDELRQHSWPGNVRELANYITRRIKLGSEEHIDLSEYGALAGRSHCVARAKEGNLQLDPLHCAGCASGAAHRGDIATLDQVKKTYVKQVYAMLTDEGVSQNQICKFLGISVNTLKKLIANEGS